MSTTLKRREMFIGGKWGPGSGSEYQEVVNPATGKVIAEVPRGTEEDVNTAVTAARSAFDDVWYDTTPRERSERLLEGRASGEYMKGFTSILRREALGVVGSIAPWNYPLMMTAWKIGPALAAGNTVVLKPSEWTPLTALRLAELIQDEEIFPPGVFNVVTGAGERVGAALVRHPGVAMV